MKLRVWNIINPPNGAMHWTVQTPEEGYALMNREADAQLECDGIVSNAFGLEYFDEEDQEWYDWYSDEGEELDEYMERINASI